MTQYKIYREELSNGVVERKERLEYLVIKTLKKADYWINELKVSEVITAFDNKKIDWTTVIDVDTSIDSLPILFDVFLSDKIKFIVLPVEEHYQI